jgi:hypothetical protein
LPERLNINNKLAKVYPNPSTGQFYISFSQKKRSNYRIEIVNVLGIKLYEKVLYDVDRRDHIIKEPFASGFYLINIYDLKTGQHSTYKQIVK